MNFDSVFECYPGVNEIYVVDGMPFLDPSQASSHANSTGKPMSVVKRKVNIAVAENHDGENNDSSHVKKGRGATKKNKQLTS